VVTLLTDSGVWDLPSAELRDGDLWLNDADLRRATGFDFEPEGLCRGVVCVPLPPDREDEFADRDMVNVSAFWRHFGGPVRHDAERQVWVLGEPAADRAARLMSLQAPDFTLPDAQGAMHSLSAYRGRKVFLVAWASW